MVREKRFTKPEWSWIFYDWANSVYATIIMAAVFPIYFKAIAPDGDVWWGYGTSIATFVVALLAPVLGAIADYKGMKKKLFLAFLIIGVAFTATMAIFGPWQLVLVGYILSYIGFCGANLFYDSFLTDVASVDRMDKVSTTGFAMGYIGGSTIPFVISIVLTFVLETQLAIKISVVLTSVWWLVFSIPMLRNVKQEYSLGEPPKAIVKHAFKNIGRTFVDIVKRKGLFLFILAYFFYIDGVGTVIHMSTIYGATLGLSTTGMIIALLVTQLVGVPCSILFSTFSKKFGSIKLLLFAVCTYFVICVVGFYMGFSIEGPQAIAEQQYTAAFQSAVGTIPETGELAELYEAGISNISKADRDTLFAQSVTDSALDGATAQRLQDSVVPALQSVTEQGTFDAALGRSNIMFWCMAVLVGTCQGGIQALSRSYFGKLIPPEKSNEYFGFFDIFGRFAAVIGPALYAAIRTWTGRASLGILSLMLLFLTGGILLVTGRKHFAKEERVDA